MAQSKKKSPARSTGSRAGSAAGTRAKTGSRSSASGGRASASVGKTGTRSGRTTAPASGKRKASGTSGSAKTSARKAAAREQALKERMERQRETRNDITLVVLLIIVFFLFLSLIGFGGNVGRLLADIQFGLFGIGAWAFPFLLLAVFAHMVTGWGGRGMRGRLGAAFLLLLVFEAGSQLRLHASGALALDLPFHALSFFRTCAERHAGGGLLGGSLAWLLYYAFRMVGSWLILFGLGVIAVILLLPFSPTAAVQTWIRGNEDEDRPGLARRRELYRQRRLEEIEEERNRELERETERILRREDAEKERKKKAAGSRRSTVDRSALDLEETLLGGQGKKTGPSKAAELLRQGAGRRRKNAPAGSSTRDVHEILVHEEPGKDPLTIADTQRRRSPGLLHGRDVSVPDPDGTRFIHSDVRYEGTDSLHYDGTPAGPGRGQTRGLSLDPSSERVPHEAHRISSLEPAGDLAGAFPEYGRTGSGSSGPEAFPGTAVPAYGQKAPATAGAYASGAGPESVSADHIPGARPASAAGASAFGTEPVPGGRNSAYDSGADSASGDFNAEIRPVSAAGASASGAGAASAAASVPASGTSGSGASLTGTSAAGASAHGTSASGAGGQSPADQPSDEDLQGIAVHRQTEKATSSGTASAQKKGRGRTGYRPPPFELLEKGSGGRNPETDRELQETAYKLQETLRSFGVQVSITAVSQGPSVTRYELKPDKGIKVSKIVNLSDDIKLRLAATDIRIEAPIPGKSAVGIEVPNKTETTVHLRELIDTREFREFKGKLPFAVGKDIGGKTIYADISRMPHLLIAGATGSGKSVCINTIILSILYRTDPAKVKLLMIDPKVVELSVYKGIPHLIIPVVTDARKASAALNWAVAEMEKRYKLFAAAGVRDLNGFNSQALKYRNEDGELQYEPMPRLVVIVDELADLMMVAKNEVEGAICRLAQLARAAGIHLIIATQRPSVDVITGLIKANMPSRIAFAVSSQVDSRTILDMAGAEKLIGRGDMLFYPQNYQKPARIQGAFVSDEEVTEVVEYIKNNNITGVHDEEVAQQIENIEASGGSTGSGGDLKESAMRDEYFAKAGRQIIEKNKASIGLLQRIFKIGFNRAARIMDQLAEAGVVSEESSTRARQVLMSLPEFEEYLEREGL